MKLFFKYQSAFTLTLSLITIIPYYFSEVYLNEIPYRQYFFILILVIIKLVVMNEKAYQEKIKAPLTRDLQKSLGKSPSKDTIFKALTSVARARDISLGLIAVVLIMMGIFFQAS